MRASRKFAIDHLKRYFPDPLENPLEHIDTHNEEQEEAEKHGKEAEPLPFVDVLDADQQKTLRVMYPEKHDTIESNDLGKRELEIMDDDDPDIYAITFFHFRYMDPSSESQTLVYKVHLTFMLQALLFYFLLW